MLSGGATFQDCGWNARRGAERGGVILRDQSVLQLCNLSLSSFAGESLPQADLPCVFRRQLGELGKYTPYGLIVSISYAIPCRSISELRRVPPHVLGL